MPFRFRKSIKITKGVKVNLSKSGISTSLGKKGLSLNVGKRGAKLTTGIPGTGISNTTNLMPAGKKTRAQKQTITSVPPPQEHKPQQSQPVQSPPRKLGSKTVGIIFASIIFMCIACLAFGFILETFFPTQNTQPPITTNTSAPPASTQPPAPTADLAQTYLEEYGGAYESYAEIFTLTDCATLQQKFETAYANNQRETPGTALFRVTLGYMTATDDHMRAIGCYDQ